MARRTEQLKIAGFFNFLQNRTRPSFFRITRRSARALSLRRPIYKRPGCCLCWVCDVTKHGFVLCISHPIVLLHLAVLFYGEASATL
jgi:hypothetical protein